MRRKLLEFLRCPGCRGSFHVEDAVEEAAAPLDPALVPDDDGREIVAGRIVCDGCKSHAPIRGGIPRLVELAAEGRVQIDEQTRKSFSFEWALHRPEEGTWGMTLEERTLWYFLNGVGLKPEEVPGLRVLDAGCGNGSSTLGIARLGALAVGIDLSTGLEKHRAYFGPGDERRAALYVQGNLMDPLFAPESFDVVFSAGVLHHTPDTRRAFLGLAPLVKPGGRFYVWLYRHEPVVTPVVDTLRAVTTRMPPAAFNVLALAMAPAFQVFTRVMNLTRLRAYRPMPFRAAALGLFDIFGARYAHAHTYEEVAGWYEEAGFDAPRVCSMERRGFSVCGQKRAASASGSKTGKTATASR